MHTSILVKEQEHIYIVGRLSTRNEIFIIHTLKYITVNESQNADGTDKRTPIVEQENQWK